MEGVEIPDKLFFRIGEVAELVGVEPHVLRYWEGEFRIRPQRSPSGQRMYKRQHIVKFLQIRHLLHDEGFTIAGARKALSGDAPVPAGAVDPGAVGEVLDRLGALREQLQALRERILVGDSKEV
ncbi:MAG: MerR family transcriptional regulator [Deltaproteobacteria bacterium]|nr:MerR family transcriptional regulator [Deltaproteobacteria bacterium]